MCVDDELLSEGEDDFSLVDDLAMVSVDILCKGAEFLAAGRNAQNDEYVRKYGDYIQYVFEQASNVVSLEDEKVLRMCNVINDKESSDGAFDDAYEGLISLFMHEDLLTERSDDDLDIHASTTD